MVYLCNRILHSNGKEQLTAICNNMYDSHRHNCCVKKPGTREHISYASIHVKLKKKQY